MDINYRVSGLAGAPVILLSHSLATNLSMWDLVAPLLEDRFRIVRFDFRGHGGTPALSSSCQVADLQNDAMTVLDELGIERAYFVGLSLGGMVGLATALDQPERLLGLVVCDAGAQSSVASRASWDDRIAQVAATGIDAIVEPTLGRWFGPAFRADDRKMDWMRAMVRTTEPEGYICCVRAIQDFDVKSRLGQMTVPTLYLTGDADGSAPPQLVEELHALTPGARFEVIADAGHLSAVEQPQAVASAILKFILALEQRADRNPLLGAQA
jgi:3-oxoadipate enol-lactonase